MGEIRNHHPENKKTNFGIKLQFQNANDGFQLNFYGKIPMGYVNICVVVV